MFELRRELGEGQREAIKSIQSLENIICKERIIDVGLSSKDKERLRDLVIMIFSVRAQSMVTHNCPSLLGNSHKCWT